jgi:hypothetical protein
MSITVSEHLLGQLHAGAGMLLVQVRSEDPHDRLTPAVRSAAADIARVDDVKYVSEVFLLPDGPMVMIDPGQAVLSDLPGILTGRLTEAGVGTSEVTSPAVIGDRYMTIQSFAPAARAYLRAPLGTPIGFAPRQAPVGLLDIVTEWTRAHHTDEEVLGVFVSAETVLTWDAVHGLGGAALSSGAAVALVASDFSSAVASGAVVNNFRGAVPEATLTAAPGTAGHMREQQAVLRNHASELAWAGVTAEVDARDLLSPQWHEREMTNRPEVDRLSDILVPDAMWYQILSEGHIQRLGGAPPGSAELAGGRVELTIGEPEQWLAGHPDRPAVQAEARRLLAGCLVSSDEAFAITKQRMREARERDQDGFFPRRP